MKNVLINNNAQKVWSVYDKEMLKRLSLDQKVYSKLDVINSPDSFADTRCIFSTWGMPAFSEDEIEKYFPSLEAVFYAAGTVQSFARPFLSRGVRVFSAWMANAVPVAEYTVSAILLANKGFFAYTNTTDSRDREKQRSLIAKYSGNYGARVGIIGAGAIGSLVCEMLGKSKLELLVFDPFLNAERAEQLGVRLCGLDEIFSSCSVISNHLANNSETQGMLDYSLFSLMPEYSTFINTGRGAQVVEDDLVRILNERPDIVALLDVTYPEPPSAEHPFHMLRNCILTPHIAGSIGDETHRMAEYMADEYERITNGIPPMYEVTAEALSKMA